MAGDFWPSYLKLACFSAYPTTAHVWIARLDSAMLHARKLLIFMLILPMSHVWNEKTAQGLAGDYWRDMTRNWLKKYQKIRKMKELWKLLAVKLIKVKYAYQFNLLSKNDTWKSIVQINGLLFGQKRIFKYKNIPNHLNFFPLRASNCMNLQLSHPWYMFNTNVI